MKALLFLCVFIVALCNGTLQKRRTKVTYEWPLCLGSADAANQNSAHSNFVRQVDWTRFSDDSFAEHWHHLSYDFRNIESFDGKKLGHIVVRINCNDPKHDRYISEAIRTQHAWEAHKLRAALALLSSVHSKNMIDMGANIGSWGLVFAKLGYSVHFIEMSRENMARLASSLRKMSDDSGARSVRARCTFNALSNENAVVSMAPTSAGTNFGNKYVTGSNRLAANWTNDVDDYGKTHSLSVRIDDIDWQWFANADGAPEIGFWKSDIETFELPAFDGARNMLCNSIVHVIQLEVWRAIEDDKVRRCKWPRLLSVMEQLGYEGMQYNSVAVPPTWTADLHQVFATVADGEDMVLRQRFTSKTPKQRGLHVCM
jgi:FkbM family methyltransferase